MIPYLARLLDIMMNNNAFPGDWKKSHGGFHLQRGRSIGSWKPKTGQEAMIPYLARLLDITMNSNAIPGEWGKSHCGSHLQRGRSIGSSKLEHVIAGYLRQVWEFSGWLYEGQHGFRPGYSRESQIVCQNIADSPVDGVRTNVKIIDISKSFDLVPHDRLLTKIAATGVNLRVVVWVEEFLLGRSHRVRVDGQMSEEVGVTSGVPQASVLGPLLFLAYVNDIWRNTESNTRLFADNCIIYRNIMDSSDIDK